MKLDARQGMIFMFGLVLLPLTGCGSSYTPGGPNDFSKLASKVLMARGYCTSIADCDERGVVKTGQFEESNVEDGRYVTRQGIYVALIGVGPGTVEEVSSNIGATLSTPEMPCVRISMHASARSPMRPAKDLTYVCPAGTNDM